MKNERILSYGLAKKIDRKELDGIAGGSFNTKYTANVTGVPAGDGGIDCDVDF